MSTSVQPKWQYVQYCADENAGLVFLSGQGAIKGGKPVEGGIREHAEQALQNMLAVLKSAGLGKEHVLKVTVFLKNIEDRDWFESVYAEFFSDHDNWPARTFVGGVTPPNGSLLEIEAVASMKEVRRGPPGEPSDEPIESAIAGVTEAMRRQRTER